VGCSAEMELSTAVMRIGSMENHGGANPQGVKNQLSAEFVNFFLSAMPV